MRIALMTNNYKPFIGGVPISVERLSQELVRQGHQVTVFAPTYEEQKAEENVFRYSSFRKKVLGGVTLPNPFDRRIEKEFSRQKFDVIHVHHPMLIGKTAVYLSRKYKIPLAFTYHTRYEQYLNTFAGTDILEPFVPMYLRSFLKHCDIIFTPTKGLQEYLKTACRVPAHKLEILPTGLTEESYLTDEEKTLWIRRKYKAENCPLFLTVSRISPEKNIEFLIESLSLVKKQCKKPFRWILVGEGPEMARYQEKCRELQLEDEVSFVGKVSNEQIAPYFHAADAFLFASKTETQGIVILEAFAGKTPVYALNATGVSDLVVNGENGYLTEENVSEYAAGIVDFLNGKADLERLSRGAYKSALEYREEAVAIQAVRLYNRIIAADSGCKILRIEGRQWRTTNITF